MDPRALQAPPPANPQVGRDPRGPAPRPQEPRTGGVAGTAALVNGHRGQTGGGIIAAPALVFGVAALLAAAMPNLVFEAIVFLGSTPIGGPLTGWLGEVYDPRLTLVLAGISGLSAAWPARMIFTRMSERAGARSRPLGATV
jgi:hypothetical protein